jgi:hypothetical protein
MSKVRASVVVLGILAVAVIGVWAMAQASGEDTKKAEASSATTAAVVDKPAEVSLKVSGPGAINDSTVKAGEKFCLDVYFSNDRPHRGFTMGFKLSSPDIKTVIHPSDSGHGLNANGDLKGYNGWQDNSIWDLRGVIVSTRPDWDGKLPDWFGLGGVTVKQHFMPQEAKKVLSFDLIVPTPGTLVVDSTWFPPSNSWKFADKDENGQEQRPAFHGPYKFKVVK